MSWSDEMVNTIRSSLANGSSGGIKVAVMTGANTVKVGNMDLLPQDLYIPDRLLAASCTKVSEIAPADGGACTDRSTYSAALKAGDPVLVCQLSDDKFAILGRVVKGA